LYSFLASFGGRNLRLCVIDTGHRFSDARILQLPLRWRRFSSMPARAAATAALA